MSDASSAGGTQPRCRTCGEAHELDQEYCLECGARLPAAPVQREETPLWAWAAVVTLALVAIISGIVVALFASSDDPDLAQGASPPPALEQPASAIPEPPPAEPVAPPVTVPIEGPEEPTIDPGGDPATDPQPSDPTPETPLTGEDLFPSPPDEPGIEVDPGVAEPPGPPGLLDPTAPTPPTLPEPPPEAPTFDPPPNGPPADPPLPQSPPAGEAEEWPTATDGFTVILASIPEARGRSEADVRASRARAAGLDDVGVLRSADFGSLREGYWVTFAGTHDTLNAARAELAPARAAGFPSAYTRRVAS